MSHDCDEVEVIPAQRGSDDLFSADDEFILSQNRKLRTALINKLTPDNKVPEDKADKNMLIQLMNAQDSEIIARARLKIAAKSDETANNLAAMVGQAMKDFKHGSRPVVTKEAFQIPAHIVAPKLVPGQMDIGTVPLTMKDLEE